MAMKWIPLSAMYRVRTQPMDSVRLADCHSDLGNTI